uniref:2-oxoglutarate-dependent dioxygenase DAO n=1 Tax=Oryza barthii TaxID=65489 RepID=A0A0D3GB55_9ORYZ
MGGEAAQLTPARIDFSGVDPAAPGTGRWAEVRAEVMGALTTHGWFDAHYPQLTPELRASLFDAAVRPLFALPVHAKRRNHYGPEKPFHGYLGGLPGLDSYESLAIADGLKPESVRAFADLVLPRGANDDGFCEIVNGAAKRIADLEGMVRRMILEGLGVAEHHEAQGEPFWHLFRMSEYRAPNSDEKVTGYIAHQDTNWLSIVCQNEVNGNEMRTRDGEWVLVKPSPTSLIVNVGNALRAWTNDRLHAPFHRIMVSGHATRYTCMLFSVPNFMIQIPDELVDESHPPRFKAHDNDDFIRFCLTFEGVFS